MPLRGEFLIIKYEDLKVYTMITAILTVISLFLAFFAANLGRIVFQARHSLEKSSWIKSGLIGLLANFCDTLGIGSFAITIPLLKIFKQCEDALIPGTLNVGASMPTMLEALIFIQVIHVEPMTLISMIIASSIGAWLGARFVCHLPKKQIQYAVGLALLITAIFIFATLMNWLPHSTANAIGLHGIKLIIGILFYFFMGSLTAIGIGSYAPSLAIAFMLGLSPRAIFPIMMGASAFLIPAAGLKFMQENKYSKKTALAFGLCGLIGVLIAAYIVKTLPLQILQWVVIGILLYTSALMLKSTSIN